MCLCVYYLRNFLVKCLCVICPPIYRLFFSDCNKKNNLICTSFVAGFLLGQVYYYYLLKRIPFPHNIGFYLSLVLSVLLARCETARRHISETVPCCSGGLDWRGLGINFNGEYITHLQLADDMMVMAETMESSAFERVGLKKNMDKTKVMLNTHVAPTPIKVGDSTLEVLDDYDVRDYRRTPTATASIFGIGNAISIQVRCICLLIFPMYCGKSGRGVLKAVILTYVVAGPITNMGLNAREVVRVFACSTQLSFNLSKQRYEVMVEPLKRTALGLQSEMDQMKDALRSIRDVVAPIEHEIEDTEEVEIKREQSDNLDGLLKLDSRSRDIEVRYQKIPGKNKEDHFLKLYEKKLEYRCQHQLTEAMALCIEAFTSAYEDCYHSLPKVTAFILCRPLRLSSICNFIQAFQKKQICDSMKQMDRGLGEGYVALEKAKRELGGNLKKVNLKYIVTFERKLYDIQDAKETGERVLHSFEEKHIIMGLVFGALNVCMALLFLRIVVAAVSYHEMYLTTINYDNVYITRYFKRLDEKRKKRNMVTLLPLKKMERYKYIDIHTMSYTASPHSKLVTQMLKVMLEVVTATTFVMLDRLFYEALDVVRQHAQVEVVQQGTQDLKIKVQGTGVLAALLRKLVSNLSSSQSIRRKITNKQCVPQPRAMPPIYFLKIYGGYLWILLLLYVNPYTLRLSRQICSYFYPRREKQRVLHLYNDILKKRMKMDKTLRRKAVQAVRAHYLSGENLLSLRMKFPYLLGWLNALPAARLTCLICGETEPRKDEGASSSSRWHCCCVPKCPFVYCAECWKEAGARCLACDPSLNELSDVDSLSEDDQLRY